MPWKNTADDLSFVTLISASTAGREYAVAMKHEHEHKHKHKHELNLARQK
jgi:hypothetical protein